MLKRTLLHRRAVAVLAVLVFAAVVAGSLYAAAIARPPTALIAGMQERRIELPGEVLTRLRGKQRANLEQLRQNYFVRDGMPFAKGSGEKAFQLIPLDKMEYRPTTAQINTAKTILPSISRYSAYIAAGPRPVLVPDSVDHRDKQTPIKDQNNRGTCVCFASMAGLEVAYGGGSLDLSEQYANYLFMKAEGAGCKSAGLQTHMSADYLTANGVCVESVCPYQNDKYHFPAYCNNGAATKPPMRSAAEAANPYKIKTYQKIWRNDSLASDSGTWINNPRYLMALLAGGHDIVFGTHVAGWVRPYGGVLDVKLDSSGNPLPSVGGHAMLIVGYDRPGEYFIVKNSWGPDLGHDGYLYLSFDYIRTYAKYGYVITAVEPVLTAAPVRIRRFTPGGGS